MWCRIAQRTLFILNSVSHTKKLCVNFPTISVVFNGVAYINGVPMHDYFYVIPYFLLFSCIYRLKHGHKTSPFYSELRRILPYEYYNIHNNNPLNTHTGYHYSIYLDQLLVDYLYISFLLNPKPFDITDITEDDSSHKVWTSKLY